MLKYKKKGHIAGKVPVYLINILKFVNSVI